MGKSKDDTSKIKEMTLKGMEQDRMKLLARQPFISLVLMHLELIPISGGCTTACTDGERIFMNCKFYAKLDQDERLFVLAHEAWHCVLLHQERCQDRDHSKFNIAADLEIHFILMDEQMKEPFVLPHDPNWKGLSAEEIYEKLKKSKKPSKKIVLGHDSKNIHPNAEGEGFDEHRFSGGSGSKEKDGDQSATPNGGLQDEQASEDSDYAPGCSPGAKERIRSIVIQTAQTIERRQGFLPAHIRGIVDQLRRPQLNWHELLRQFITAGYSYGGTRRWLPPARRYIGMGLYLQSRRDSTFNAVMAIDTSGSTTNDLPQFFCELSSLLNTFGRYTLTVIQCDCVIQHVETFSGDLPLPRDYKWKSFGHGGTSFVPPFDYVKENKMNPDIFIYLTDGFGDAPKMPPRFPVLWVLTSDGKEPATWGTKIKLQGSTYNG